MNVKMLIGANSEAHAFPAREALTMPGNPDACYSTAPAMREVQRLAVIAGRCDLTVLVQGETGVGKEVLARAIHAGSLRAKKPFLKLNCAAIPSELVESGLFGYERGAFTGASMKKSGMFEIVNGGTILLDEIGDMDFKMQAKLLQVLQDQEFLRVGGTAPVRVDVRVIAATNSDLEKAIDENRFREDLYYRLNMITLHLPPLRERKEDIVRLANFFMRKHTAPDATLEEIPLTLQTAFLEYNWPGNVRELENIVRRFIVFRDVASVEQELRRKLARVPAALFSAAATKPSAEFPLAEDHVDRPNEINCTNRHSNGNSADAVPVLMQVAAAKREAERTAILAALKHSHWNRKQASDHLGIDYKALLYKMKVLSIRKPESIVA